MSFFSLKEKQTQNCIHPEWLRKSTIMGWGISHLTMSTLSLNFLEGKEGENDLIICLPYEFKMLRVLSLCSSSKLFPRWVSHLQVLCPQPHRTGVSVPRGDSRTLPHLLQESSLIGLFTLLLSPNKKQRKISMQTSSFLAF